MANLKFLKRIGYSNTNTLDDCSSSMIFFRHRTPEVALVREPETAILTV
jgi:hypothetical protein